MRRYGIFGIVGAAILLLSTTALAPKTIAWWYRPPVQGSMVLANCDGAVLWAMNELVRAQLWSVLLGFAAGVGLAFGTRKKVVTPPATGQLPGAAGQPASPQPPPKQG
jgi:hypothetical protein